jgi:hypothetical protein
VAGVCSGTPGASGGQGEPSAERAQALLSGLSGPGAPAPPAPPASQPERGPTAGPGETPTEADFIWPADGWIVQGLWAGHPSGIDIGAATGDPIRATRAGTVTFAGGDPCCGYGYFIIIDHGDGWTSLYGHLSHFDAKLGDKVKQNEKIGEIGMTGKADGPHLHFELRLHGGVVDPLQYLWPHRVAPPPPPYVASDPIAQPGSVQPEPTPVPEEPALGISASTAISNAIPWLAAEADAAYELDASTCSATPTGPNWIVTCRALLVGCYDTVACSYVLSACVLSQPLLVASTC